MQEEELKDLAHRLLEHFNYWDGPRVSVYNDEGVLVQSEINEGLYEILKAMNDVIEGD